MVFGLMGTTPHKVGKGKQERKVLWERDKVRLFQREVISEARMYHICIK